MGYGNQDKTLWSSYRRNQDKTKDQAWSKSYMLCYTRERVKREEKEILQHQTTSRYIHFIRHPRIIPHAPMYHPNIQPWSYTPPAQLLSTQPRHNIRCRNTSNHFLIITNNTATISCHSFTVPASTHVSVSPHTKPFHKPDTIPYYPSTHHTQYQPWQYPPPWFEVLQEHSPMALAS